MASRRQLREDPRVRRGVLARLAQDARGVTAVMMAAMLVPLLLFVGSAVDVSRVYTVKARLQQACDAGVLAGRRVMTGTGSTLDTYAVSQATGYFNNNFHLGWMSTAAVAINGQPAGTVFVPAKTSQSQVQGTATLSVPMVLMKIFGFQPVKLTATCEARYDTADADIMFVLDVTGSMGCTTNRTVSDCNNYVVGHGVTNSDGTQSVAEESGSRIDGLRTAVLNFFDTVTDSNNVDPSTNFRFGFVPYNATANVGALLRPLGYLKTSVQYQSRDIVGDTIASSSALTNLNKSSSSCPTGTVRNPAAARTYTSSGTATQRVIYYDTSANKCYQRDDQLVPTWQYRQEPAFDTTQFITGAAVNNPATADSSTSTWTGCVEERLDPSSDNQTSFSYTSPPKDLDPDGAPATASDGWAPWWPDVEYYRKSTPEISGDTWRTPYLRYIGNNWYNLQSYNIVACPVSVAKRLNATMLPGNSSASAKATVRSSIQTYLSANSGFRPYGTTYHDVGMLWGLRLISPTGMFANDTAAWSGHNAPNRFIIFLTDGDMESDPASDGGVYSAYGMEKFDSRVANGATGSSLDDYHNARFLAVCQMAKNRNIKVFTIAYAQAKTPQLISCASPGQDYYASDSASLNTAFASIARQVALLRISK